MEERAPQTEKTYILVFRDAAVDSSVCWCHCRALLMLMLRGENKTVSMDATVKPRLCTVTLHCLPPTKDDIPDHKYARPLPVAPRAASTAGAESHAPATAGPNKTHASQSETAQSYYQCSLVNAVSQHRATL
ncbi:hypothetical protein FQN60_004232 [Etheostoma spectabile]|uniref:Uncharacterized protein n=1 Tax=Etheostoma spectabile TaxID=54343 RepID=A0A5J5CT22_9PERO|nr:hypothetical protein FQN60_004232 [Etheostoma spectabile]